MHSKYKIYNNKQPGNRNIKYSFSYFDSFLRHFMLLTWADPCVPDLLRRTGHKAGVFWSVFSTNKQWLLPRPQWGVCEAAGHTFLSPGWLHTWPCSGRRGSASQGLERLRVLAVPENVSNLVCFDFPWNHPFWVHFLLRISQHDFGKSPIINSPMWNTRKILPRS